MIPRNIIVTDRECPEAWLAKLAKDNPGYRICFFDDQAARDLIAEHFPGGTLAAYDKIRPGAYRADLFRYCALQVLGGIYTDALIPYSLPFSRLWDLDQDRVFLVLDKKPRAIQVAIMACNCMSRFMQLCQQRAARNIHANYYGESPFSITGPEMAWRCFWDYTGELSPELGQSYAAIDKGEPAVEFRYQVERTAGNYRDNVAEAVLVSASKEVMFPYKLNRLRDHRDENGYYSKAWKRRTVYGEKMPSLRRLLRKLGPFDGMK